MNHHRRLTMNKFWVLRFQNAAKDVGDVQVRMNELRVNCKSF